MEKIYILFLILILIILVVPLSMLMRLLYKERAKNETKAPHKLRVITYVFRLLCSYRFLLSVFFVLLGLLICEACGIIALPRPPHPYIILQASELVLIDLSLYLIPISTLWARICSPRSPWISKHALLWASVMMSASIFSFKSSILDWSTDSINEPFIWCIVLPIILGSISFLLVHGLYSLICFIYRCIYKTLTKKCEYVYAASVSYIYLVLFLTGGYWHLIYSALLR